MVFLDETGRRWKRIKHSTAGLILISSLPVAALIAGSIVYQPHWSGLSLLPKSDPPPPVIHRGTALGASTSTVTTPAQLNTASHRVAYTASTVQPITISISARPLAPSPTPQATPTPTPKSASPSPTPTPDNTHNDFGQGHKPTH